MEDNIVNEQEFDKQKPKMYQNSQWRLRHADCATSGEMCFDAHVLL